MRSYRSSADSWQGVAAQEDDSSDLTRQVQVFLQDPFANRQTDTPVTALSRTIEINLREALGETELPPD